MTDIKCRWGGEKTNSVKCHDSCYPAPSDPQDNSGPRSRLESRNINLSQEQMSRLNQGVSKARDKSINESLVMMDNLAFIVNIKNNTVVTALESNEESNVFTNIDGAVIV